MTASLSNVLAAYVARLTAYAPLTALVGANKIYNHPPQNLAFPFIVTRLTDIVDWSTKTDQGFEGYLVADLWTDVHGDVTVLNLFNAVNACLQDQPLTLTAGQNVIIRHESSATQTDADGNAHVTTCRYRINVGG